MFGWQVLQRGELLRALRLLDEAHRYLLWMERLATGATQNGLTPLNTGRTQSTPGLDRKVRSVNRSGQRTELLSAYRHTVIERTWELVAPVLEGPPDLHPYRERSWGPEAVQQLIASRRWSLPDE